ncbi:alpha/beta hydrolase fold domain-containing protein [Streptomyces sp. YU58]|uniref:alpha/beta hydrolase fold domain-containing protein n=1 Tax=Streptomyces sp. SX92 TaxID=3158972 RepID=UPI0027B8824B|nr:alpha/beta hydrolase fold domain-containing protein [Streptomyces coralus]WLW51051.1 alpha/beta hydrolase fold domain-containing protein [Streptomyces coralus]
MPVYESRWRTTGWRRSTPTVSPIPPSLPSTADLLGDPDAGQVTIMGDSVGAGLALGVAQNLVGSGLPQPARVVLISPLDPTLTSPAVPEVETRDPFLTTSRLLAAGRGWAGGDDSAQLPTQPRQLHACPWRPSTSTSALGTCVPRTSAPGRTGCRGRGGRESPRVRQGCLCLPARHRSPRACRVPRHRAVRGLLTG